MATQADKTTESTPIMDRLKKETQANHSKLESLPYFGALMAHRLPLECYVNQLRALAIIHGVLENEIANAEDQHLMAVWDDEFRKLPLLEQDSAFFKPRVALSAASSNQAALAMADKIRLRRVENPLSLLGYLYVLEGSTLGNRMHRPDISKTFHLEGLTGCAYYASYGDQVQSHWSRFSRNVNAAITDESFHDAIIQAAHEAFAGLERLYTALFPLDETEKSLHVTQINPEAGNHPTPDDQREIDAALQASDRAWNEYPYYEKRYGQRGKRFSDSDLCWLATLVEFDREIVRAQIEWLSRVLATRGMPSILLEKTLLYLYEELSMAIPEKEPHYQKLRMAADFLKAKRTHIIPETDFQALANEFEQAIGPEMADAFRNTGDLLLSAFTDEQNGIQGAVLSLREWLTNAECFSGEWIDAVNAILKKAEAIQK